jgi:hypothetical protein
VTHRHDSPRNIRHWVEEVLVTFAISESKPERGRT